MSEPQLHSFSTSRSVPVKPGPDDTHDEDQTIIQQDTAGVDEAQDVEIEDAEVDAGDDTTENMEEEIRPDDNMHKDEEEDEEEDEDDQAESTTLENGSTVDAPEEIRDDEAEEEELSGTTSLQLSKIKKIFKTDPEHTGASEAAVFTTAIATELFIQYFTEQASLNAKTEKRKKLQYHDFAAAVSNLDNLNFLGDLVPKTFSLQKLVEQDRARLPKKATATKDTAPKELAKGQKVLNFSRKILDTESSDVTREGTAELEEIEEIPATANEQQAQGTTPATSIAALVEDEQDEDVVMLE
ncbi:hypothetical protein WICPIJ_004781 [Wickerhamomyces pijperi]|uniref:Transcription factor CBF/NF-Y/archaeal histone domain-containing protein n=1 Tax=Wickerhamomyces pijperi TaxID=599730 RepID=A0A9P8Q7E5_WICPI|nr:hypothetical protein WICPIJ_004781 [Wickerhamomyces pijperi]